MIKINSDKYYEMSLKKKSRTWGPGFQLEKHEDVCTTLMSSLKGIV